MSSRFPLVCAVILKTATAGYAWSQELAPSMPARGMALTTPKEGMELDSLHQLMDVPLPPRNPSLGAPQAVDLTPAHKHHHLSRGDALNQDGRLPNQRTGPKHEHVVRDICIGC